MPYLHEFGQTLIDNGYYIVPIKPGEKRPSLYDWTKIKADRPLLRTWLKQPNLATAGIGILTEHTPAIDIDVPDAEFVRNVYQGIKKILGVDLPYRIGRAPRLLLLTRTDTPFTKISSKKYETILGETAQLEILGAGQQFAAFHTHPTTLKPYTWPGFSPESLAANSLPTITENSARRIVEFFDTLAQFEIKAGRWFSQSGENTALSNGADPAARYLLEHSVPKANNAPDITTALAGLSSEDRSRWLAVGMALHHQFSGADEGYQIWDNWSQTNGGEYPGADDTLYRWQGFASDVKANVVTIGSVFKWAEEARLQESDAALQHIEKIIDDCVSYAELLGGAVLRACTAFVNDFPLLYDRIVDLLKKRARAILGSPVAVDTIRKVLKIAPRAVTELDGEIVYPWCAPFVYLTEEDKFFDCATKVTYSRQAFDAAFNRLLVDEADDMIFVSAARVALEQAKITCVHGARYLPGAPDLFHLDGLQYVNRYRPDLGATMPAQYSAADRAALALLGEHIGTLIPNAADQRVFLDYLTYSIQQPGKKINWVILLQGQEGDGKTFFAQLCAAMLGAANVRMISGEALKGQFTGWADSGHLGFIEEVKLHGHSGYETLNKIKPYLTNKTIPVRRMRMEEYQVPNVMNYVMFTNFRDALPLETSDTRYYVIYSRWSSGAELAAWKLDHADFFARLYQAVDEHAGAFRKFFMERTLSSGFRPRDRAPEGGDKAKMAVLSRDDYSSHIEDILVEQGGGLLGKNEILMSTTWLLSHWNFDSTGPERPQGKKLVTVLLRAGWNPVQLDTVDDRVKINRRKHKFWTKDAAGLEKMIPNLTAAKLIGDLDLVYDDFGDDGK
jgi:hypothetical protein